MAYSQELLNRFAQFEGYVYWMYLDTTDNVTVGVGHKLADSDAAVALSFFPRTGGIEVDAATKAAAWDAVQQADPGHTSDYYQNLTTIDMSPPGIDDLLTSDLDSFEAQLPSLYPDYASFPTPAKEGLLDMIFNLGKSKLASNFPNFNQAVNAQDWNTAADECHRVGPSEERNAAIKQLFLDAANAPIIP